MKEHVLISPLGRSPGAVSGLYYALREHPDRPVGVTQVITIATSDPLVQAAGRVLSELFQYEQAQGAPVSYRVKPITAQEFRGGEQDIGPFVAQLGRFIQQVRERGDTVHLGVTGGRSGMGALAALAAQLYGAHYLYHLWVDENIEQEGQIRDARTARMRARPDNPLLKPPADKYELVNLPFLNLVPLHGAIRRFLQTGKTPDPDSPLYGLFETYGARSLEQVFPPELTIAQASRLMELAGEWAQTEKALAAAQSLRPSDRGAYLAKKRAVEERQADLRLTLYQILHDSDIVDDKTAKELVRFVEEGGDWAELVDRAADQSNAAEVLKWLAENKDAITGAVALYGVASTTGTLIMTGLGLWLKVLGYG